MGKKKQSTVSSNTYQYLPQPENPYFKTAEGLIAGYDGGQGNVREAHARNIGAINESGNELFGSDTSPEVRDRVRQERLFRNNQDLGRNLMEAKQNEIGFKNSAYMSLGGATAPQLVQTGGTQNTVMSGGALGAIANSFAGGAGSALAA